MNVSCSRPTITRISKTNSERTSESLRTNSSSGKSTSHSQKSRLNPSTISSPTSISSSRTTSPTDPSTSSSKPKPSKRPTNRDNSRNLSIMPSPNWMNPSRDPTRTRSWLKVSNPPSRDSPRDSWITREIHSSHLSSKESRKMPTPSLLSQLRTKLSWSNLLRNNSIPLEEPINKLNKSSSLRSQNWMPA